MASQSEEEADEMFRKAQSWLHIHDGQQELDFTERKLNHSFCSFSMVFIVNSQPSEVLQPSKIGRDTKGNDCTK